MYSTRRNAKVLAARQITRVQVLTRALTLLSVTLIPAGQAAPQATSQETLPSTVEFNRDIRPILSDKCYTCHGPAKQMKTLRFDREEEAKHDSPTGVLRLFREIPRTACSSSASRQPVQPRACPLAAKHLARGR